MTGFSEAKLYLIQIRNNALASPFQSFAPAPPTIPLPPPPSPHLHHLAPYKINTILGLSISFIGIRVGLFVLFCFVVLLSHLLVAGCDIGVRFSVRPSVRPSVSPSVSPSVRLSTFMSTFDIYVKISILINYKTKQPSNLA